MREENTFSIPCNLSIEEIRQIKPQAILADIVDSPLFDNRYPHTVGFFRDSVDKEGNFEANYLELRIVGSIEEFWKFLNDLNI